MINRIKKILVTESINASQLAEKIGIQRSTLSHILSGRNNPSLDVITKILNVFPEVSAEWLIRGADNSVHVREQSVAENTPKQNVINSNPDLFSVLNTEKPQISKPEPVINDKIVAEQPGKQDGNSLKEEDKEAYVKYHDKSNSVENSTTSEISVEQVMIFFSDGTFTSHKPANKKSD